MTYSDEIKDIGSTATRRCSLFWKIIDIISNAFRFKKTGKNVPDDSEMFLDKQFKPEKYRTTNFDSKIEHDNYRDKYRQPDVYNPFYSSECNTEIDETIRIPRTIKSTRII
jgi:hypothetical protein